jgi:hypothetical protein
MPVEIRELNIKLEVAAEPEAAKNGKKSAAAPDKNEIVALCVEQVMEILKESKER